MTINDIWNIDDPPHRYPCKCDWCKAWDRATTKTIEFYLHGDWSIPVPKVEYDHVNRIVIVDGVRMTEMEYNRKGKHNASKDTWNRKMDAQEQAHIR